MQATTSDHSVVGTPDGGYIVVWSGVGASDTDGGIFARKFDRFGNEIFATKLLNTTTVGVQSHPSLAVDGTGNFAVAWTGPNTDGDADIFVRRFQADGTPLSDEITANKTTTGDQTAPSVALDATGGLVVVWQSDSDQDGDKTGIYGQRFSKAADLKTLSGGEFSINKYTTGDQTTPTVAMNAAGAFVVVWQSEDGQDGAGKGVYAQAYTNTGAKNGDEIAINQTTAGDQYAPAVAIDGSGNYFVTWTGNGATDSSGIWLRGFTPTGGNKISETQVNVSTSGNQIEPTIAYDAGSSSLVMAWSGNGNQINQTDNSGVFYRRFTTAGLGSGGEFLVNQSDPSGIQSTPSVTFHKPGEFVVVWSGAGSGDASGVYSRRFYDAVNVLGVLVGGSTGQITDATRVVSPVTSDSAFAITFTEAVDPTTAQDISRYAVTVDTGGGPVPVAITSAVLSGQTVTLSLASAIPAGTITLTVRGDSSAVLDLNGRPIDGDRDGNEGGNYTLSFTITPDAPVNATVPFDQITTTPRSVAVAPDGHYVVVWQGNGPGDTNGVFARIFEKDGTSRTGDILVNTSVAGSQSLPAVDMDPNGNFVVTWTGDGTNNDVFFQRFDRNGTRVGLATLVNTYLTGTQTSPTVAYTSTGGFIIAWAGAGSAAETNGIYAQRYSSDGKVAGTNILVNTTTAGIQSTPSIAVDAKGNFLIAWQSDTGDGDGSGVFARRFASTGAATSSEFRLNATTTGDQTAPVVRYDASGNFVAAWQGPDADGTGIFARRFAGNGTPLSAEIALNTVTAGAQSAPTLAVSRSGHYVVLWQSENQDGDQAGIFGRGVDPLNNLIGATEFAVNTYTTGAQQTPSVGMNAGGDLVAVWSGMVAQDAFGSGVADRRMPRVYFDPLQVTSVSVAGVGGSLVPGGSVAATIPASSALSITFNQPLNATTAQNLAHYTLTVDGVPQTITSALIAGQTVTLSLASDIPVSPTAQNIGLTITDAVIAEDGRALDGDYSGTPGGNYQLAFVLQTALPAGFAEAGGPMSVASLPDGRYVVARAGSGTGDSSGIFAQTFHADGTPSGAEFRLNDTTANIQSNPSIGVTASGEIVAVWQSLGQDGSSWGVFGRRFTWAGMPVGDEFRVNQATASAQQYPSISVDADGDFVVAWQSDGQTGVGEQAAYVRRFDATDAPLSAESLVAVSPSGVDLLPVVAVDTIGRYVVAWQGNDANRFGVLAQRYNPDGTTAGNAIVVNTTATGDQLNPAIGMDADGGFVVAWASDGDAPGSVAVFAQQFLADGTPLSDQVLVSQSSVGTRYDPTVAVSRIGQYIVGWTSVGQDGDGLGVYARRFSRGGAPLGNEFLVASVTTADQQFPAVAVDANGDLVVAWQTPDDDGNPIIVNKRYDSNNVAGPIVAGVFPRNLPTTPDNVIIPGSQLAFTPNGLTVTFDQSVNGAIASSASNYRLFRNGVLLNPGVVGASYRYDIATRKYTVDLATITLPPGAYELRVSGAIFSDVTGTPLDGNRDGLFTGEDFSMTFTLATGEEGATQSTTGTQSTGSSTMNSRSVAVAPNGQYVVVWSGVGQADSNGVYARVFDKTGQPLTDEFLVNSFTTGTQTAPTVAIDGDGDFVIAWQSGGQDGDGYGIYARRFNASGNPLGDAFSVSQSTLGDQVNPAIALDADGDFVIAWSGNGTISGQVDSAGIFYRRYDAAGNPLTGELRANNYTTGTQDTPAVAADLDGGFVVAWGGTGPSDASGIYFHRFTADGQTVGIESRANVGTAGAERLPAIGSDGRGNVVIAWQTNDASGDGIFFRRFAADNNPLSGDIRANAYTTNNQQFATVAVDFDGDFVVGWSGAGAADGNGVWFSRYDNLGNIVSSDNLVNGSVGYVQFNLSVGVDSDGDLVTVWTDGASDGSGNGVFSRRFIDGTRPNFSGPIVAGVFPGTSTTPLTTITEDAQLASAPLQLTLTFSRAVLGGDQIENYQVLRNGSPVPITGVTYGFDPVTRKYTAQLALTNTANAQGNYEVRVLGAITDVAQGIRLDGDRNGIPFGEDFVRHFQVATVPTVPTEDQVNVTVSGNQTSTGPQAVATAADGRYVVVWAGNGSGDVDGIFARVFSPNGVPLSGEILVNQYTTGLQTAPAVAMDSTGNFVVAWQTVARSGESGTEIYARQFDQNGIPRGDEFRANTTTTDAQTNPAVASDALGNFVMAWESANQSGDTGLRVIYRQFTLTGAAVAGEQAANQYTTGNQVQPAVAMDANGDFVIAWSGAGSGDADGIYFRRFGPSGTSSEARANTNTTGVQSAPAVAMGIFNDFVMTWQDDNADGSGLGVVAQRFTSGTPVGANTLVNTTTSGDQRAPSVAVYRDGSYLVAWEGQDASGTGIVYRQFDNTSVAQTGEIIANRFTAGAQTAPSVSVDASGLFTFAWTSNGQDGAGDGVYALREPAPITRVASVQINGGNALQPDERTVGKIPQAGAIAITFTRALNPASATNPANYMLITSDSVVHTVTGATLSSDGHTVILTFNGGDISPTPGVEVGITLTARGNILDTGGQAMDGDDDGNAGGDFHLSFTILSPVPLNDGAIVHQTVIGTQTPTPGRALAVAADGRYVVTWSGGGSADADGGIYVRVFDPSGVPLTDDILVNQTTLGLQLFPSVAVSATGNFVVTWETPNQDGSGYGIYARRFDRNGVPLAGEFLVNESTSGDQLNPTATMDDDGDFVITWNSGSSVYFRRYDLQAQAIGGETLVTATADDQYTASVAMDAIGNFVVAWVDMEQDANGNGISFRRYGSNGTPLSGPIVANSYTTGNQHSPSVSRDAAGRFVIAWAGAGSGDLDGIFFRRFDENGQPLSGATRANTTTVNAQIAPTVSLDRDGDFIVAWSGNGSGDSTGVYYQRYDSGGTPQNITDTQANVYTTSNQYAPTVRMGSQGDFVLVWDSVGQDGFGEGVVARVFSVSTPPSATPAIPPVVVDEDSPPVVIPLANYFVDQQTTPSTDLTYQIVASTNPGLIGVPVIDPVTKELTLSFAPDASGFATLTIRATDADGLFVDTLLDVTVNPVNDAPVLTIPAGPFSTDEDTPLSVMGVSVADSDLGSGRIQITVTANQGTVSLASIAGLVFDTGTGTDDSVVTFRGLLTDVNAALATITYTPTPNFPGSALMGLGGFTLAANDLGNTGSGGPQDAVPQTVDITVNAINDAPVNHVPLQLATSINIPLAITSVSVSDVDAGTADIVVTLSVGTGTLTLSDTIPGGVVSGQMTGNGTSSVTITAPQAAINATLTVSGGLTYTPPNGYSGTTTFTILTDDQGNTGNGGPLTDSDTIDLVVTDQNLPPSNTLPATFTTDEDTPLVLSGISVADPDAGTGNIKVTFTVTNGTDGTLTVNTAVMGGVSSGQVTTNGTNMVVITAPLAAINATLADAAGLTFTPSADFHGNVTLTMTTDDQGHTGPGGPLSDTDMSTITVNAVNDPPQFTLTPTTITVDEDAGDQTISEFITLDSIGPLGESGTATVQSVTVTNTTGGLTFATAPAVDLATRKLTFTTAPDSNGSATLDVTVVDDNGTPGDPSDDVTTTHTFTIVVNPINDAPTFDLPGGNPPATNEDEAVSPIIGFVTNFQPGPATALDEVSQSLIGYTVTQTGSTGSLVITSIDIAPNGTLSYTIAPDTFGTATFSVVATDNGPATPPDVNMSLPRTFTITVNNVNDLPTNSGAVTVPPVYIGSGPVVIPFADLLVNAGAGPNETDSLTITAVGSPVGGTVQIAGNTVVFTPAPGYQGPASFAYTITETTGAPPLSVPGTANLTILGINDAPSFVAGPDITVTGNSNQFIPSWATNIHAGPADEAGQQLTFLVSITGTTGTLNFSSNPVIDPVTGTRNTPQRLEPRVPRLCKSS
ncbi:MAG: cadherin-like domain-containing protein [Bacteroidales bacterium]|nr:cadherin-like domain-containing protein [Bacteroidales bacterium]